MIGSLMNTSNSWSFLIPKHFSHKFYLLLASQILISKVQASDMLDCKAGERDFIWSFTSNKVGGATEWSSKLVPGIFKWSLRLDRLKSSPYNINYFIKFGLQIFPSSCFKKILQTRISGIARLIKSFLDKVQYEIKCIIVLDLVILLWGIMKERFSWTLYKPF